MKYEVVSPIKKDDRSYEPGDSINLSQEEADRMPWAVKAPAPLSGAEENQQAGDNQDQASAKPINRPPWYQKLLGGVPQQAYIALVEFRYGTDLIKPGAIVLLADTAADDLGGEFLRVPTKKEYEDYQLTQKQEQQQQK